MSSYYVSKAFAALRVARAFACYAVRPRTAATSVKPVEVVVEAALQSVKLSAEPSQTITLSPAALQTVSGVVTVVLLVPGVPLREFWITVIAFVKFVMSRDFCDSTAC